MMKEHCYSNEIKSINLQTSLYDNMSQSATASLSSAQHCVICLLNRLSTGQITLYCL